MVRARTPRRWEWGTPLKKRFAARTEESLCPSQPVSNITKTVLGRDAREIPCPLALKMTLRTI